MLIDRSLVRVLLFAASFGVSTSSFFLFLDSVTFRLCSFLARPRPSCDGLVEKVLLFPFVPIAGCSPSGGALKFEVAVDGVLGFENASTTGAGAGIEAVTDSCGVEEVSCGGEVVGGGCTGALLFVCGAPPPPGAALFCAVAVAFLRRARACSRRSAEVTGFSVGADDPEG